MILRELEVNKGRALSDDLLQKDRTWLLRQDFLKRIEFQVKPGTSQDKQLLMLVVQEKPQLSAAPILANKDVFGWYAGMKFRIRNLWGRRYQITTKLQFGSVENLSFTLTNPWFAGKWRLFTEFNFYITKFRYQFNDHPNPFNEKDLGIMATVGKAFGRKWRWGLLGGYEEIRVDDPSVTLSGKDSDDLYQLGTYIEFDSRDWPLYPRSGVYLKGMSHYYAPFQEYPFSRVGVDFRAFLPVATRNILAWALEFQISHGTIPVYKRFHLGGGRGIRGYSTGSLCGDNCFMASAEYRIPILYQRNPLAGLHAGWAIILFTDWAATWLRKDRFGLDKIKASAGLGVHFIWDQWVFRVEYGHRGEGWGFISFGTGTRI